jgi:hypothetical protein
MSDPFNLRDHLSNIGIADPAFSRPGWFQYGEHRTNTESKQAVENPKLVIAGAGFHPERIFDRQGSLRSGPF